MQKYVLDTNLFFNMEPGMGLGRKTEEVIKAATLGMQKLHDSHKAEFFMPPAVVAELLSFFEDKKQPFLAAFLAKVTTKSPDISKVSFDAGVFYKLVSDVRDRNLKGVKAAEDELRRVATEFMGKKELDKREFEEKVGAFVKNLRDRFRQATRFGFLDSVADLDLIVLAKELDAHLVSTDEGVIAWGRTFGVKELSASVFGQQLKSA